MRPSLNHPARRAVSACLAEIERRDWEEKEALRKFYLREGDLRKVPRPSGKQLFGFFCIVTLLIFGVGVWVVEYFK